jgi:hypothetical protein
MSTATDAIKRKIQALLAKANGTDNEHEAEAFMAKAMDLLAEHQLDLGELVGDDDPILHHVGLKQASSGHAWRWRLYSAVAQFYGCKSIHVDVGYMTNPDGSFVRNKAGKLIEGYEQRLVGRESAIITTDLMYPWIASQVRAKAKEVAAITGMSEQGQAKRVAAALIQRIYRLIADAKRAEPQTAAARNALVILDQVTAKYEEMYPPSTTTTMTNSRSRSDSLSRAAAEGIGLYRQTGGKAQARIGS